MRALAFLCATFGLSVASVAAADGGSPAQPDLKEILEVGVSPAQGNLKWSTPRSEVQHLLSDDAADATLSDGGCSYKVHLNRATDADLLAGIRLEQAAGTPEKCRARVEQLLEGMYGLPSTVKHESGWRVVTPDVTFSGPTVQSSWQTQTTCINLSWKEGAGFPGSPLIVTLGDRRHACGYDDQVVSVQRIVAAADANVSVETLQQSMKADGPVQTLKTYFGCSHPDGYRLIQSGDARAVELAAKLLDNADGCDTEMLLSSLATAIQKNPEAVLPHMSTVQGGNANRENFCIPFIAEDVSRADALAILARSEQSLLKVKRPDLQDARQTCLKEIRKYRQSLDESPANLPAAATLVPSHQSRSRAAVSPSTISRKSCGASRMMLCGVGSDLTTHAGSLLKA
jgi:hypothetical protein